MKFFLKKIVHCVVLNHFSASRPGKFFPEAVLALNLCTKVQVRLQEKSFFPVLEAEKRFFLLSSAQWTIFFKKIFIKGMIFYHFSLAFTIVRTMKDGIWTILLPYGNNRNNTEKVLCSYLKRILHK